MTADEVRCPLCQAQYSLEEVLDIALPELVLVRTVPGGNPRPQLVESNAGLNGDAWSASPHYAGGHGLAAIDAGHDIGNGAMGFGLDADAQAELEPAGDWNTPTGVADDEFDSGGPGFDTGVEYQDAASTGIVAKPSKKRKDANMAVEMLKAMIGGALGLLITYLALLWFMQDFDPLRIGPKLPRWMVPDRHEGR